MTLTTSMIDTFLDSFDQLLLDIKFRNLPSKSSTPVIELHLTTKPKSKSYPLISKRLRRKKFSQFVDYDYVNKLSDSEKQFLEEFSQGFYNGVPNSMIGNKESYDLNNQRLRDVWNVRHKINNSEEGE